MSEEDPIDNILKKAAEIDKIVNAPAQPLPSRLAKRLDAMFATRVSEDALHTTAICDEKSEMAAAGTSQMTRILLNILSEKPMDAEEINEYVETQRLSLKGKGKLDIYGLLHQMERNGLLESKWREVSSEVIKTYRVTQKGSSLLNPTSTPLLSAYAFWNNHGRATKPQ